MVNSAIFITIFACVIAIIVITTNNKMGNVETALAEKTETMQNKEEQSMPKALTEIKAGTKNSNNYTDVESLDGYTIPVPKGYVASPDEEERYRDGVTIDGVREHHGGFVIYEKNAGETDEQAKFEIEDDLYTAQRERNQWVWVPISSEEVENMYRITESGTLCGNAYNFNSSASSYVLDKNAWYEPRLTVYDYDHTHMKQFMEGISSNDFLQEMREEFHEMLESVKTYEGFYIGRYETGNITSRVPVVRKGNNTIAWENWYGIYKKCKRLNGVNNSIRTGLIWGIQYDETLKWLIDSKEKTYYMVATDSSSWGNFRGGGRSFKPTGYSESWKANNIYDLAGNYWAYTMGHATADGRDVRGGAVWYSGSQYSAGYRADYDGIGGGEARGCRAILCIK